VTDDPAFRSPPADSPRPADRYAGDPEVRAEWDRRYAEQDRMWSGQPNGALVAEVAGLDPGRALDVGCGEGADAIWLAERGWDVTALDVSGVALDRAAGHARDAGVTVAWTHASLAEAAVSPGSFDLVSAHYPGFLRQRRSTVAAPRVAKPGTGWPINDMAHAAPSEEAALRKSLNAYEVLR